MSRKIIGVTVGTPTSPSRIKYDIKPVSYEQQTLDEGQKYRARMNIGAPSQSEVDYLHSRLPSSELVFPDMKTSDTHTIYAHNGELIVKTQGEENKSAKILTDAALVAALVAEMELTDTQKDQVRKNIGAAGAASVNKLEAILADDSLTFIDKKNDDNMILYADSGNLRMKNKNTNEIVTFSTGGGVGESVLYTAQTLTVDQKAQARENIGAASADYCFSRLPEDGSVSLYDGHKTDPYTLVAHNDCLRMTRGTTGKDVVFLTRDNMQEITESVIASLPVYNGEVEEV